VSKDLVRKPSFQLFVPNKEWKLSTVKKLCRRVDRTGSAVCVYQAVELEDLSQRVQFVVVRQFSHWYDTIRYDSVYRGRKRK